MNKDLEDFYDWVGCLDNRNGNATRHEIAICWRAWQAARGVKFTPLPDSKGGQS